MSVKTRNLCEWHSLTDTGESGANLCEWHSLTDTGESGATLMLIDTFMLAAVVCSVWQMKQVVQYGVNDTVKEHVNVGS